MYAKRYRYLGEGPDGAFGELWTIGQTAFSLRVLGFQFGDSSLYQFRVLKFVVENSIPVMGLLVTWSSLLAVDRCYSSCVLLVTN